MILGRDIVSFAVQDYFLVNDVNAQRPCRDSFLNFLLTFQANDATMKVITVALVNERWCNARFIVVLLLLFRAHGLCIKSEVFLLYFLELSDPKVA